jgi:hypothetical protein
MQSRCLLRHGPRDYSILPSRNDYDTWSSSWRGNPGATKPAENRHRVLALAGGGLVIARPHSARQAIPPAPTERRGTQTRCDAPRNRRLV